MEDLYRLLELAQQEMGADDARLEIGGREPGDESIWCALPDGHHRLVVVYDAAPDDRAALREKLALLVKGFAGTLSQARVGARPRTLDPQQALDEALDVLTVQAGARSAFVVDETSPVLWGSSEIDRGAEDVDDAAAAAELLALADASGVDLAAHLAGEVETPLPRDLERGVARIRQAAGRRERSVDGWRAVLATFAAIAACRRLLEDEPTSTRMAVHDPDLALLARRVGGIYWVGLVFEDAGFSELHAEAAMIHASPWIERLVTALPPFDPGSGGGNVARLRRLRPV